MSISSMETPRSEELACSSNSTLTFSTLTVDIFTVASEGVWVRDGRGEVAAD